MRKGEAETVGGLRRDVFYDEMAVDRWPGWGPPLLPYIQAARQMGHSNKWPCVINNPLGGQ